MARNKKYDWSDKRDICYKLYIEEEKTLPELKEYFIQALGVAKESIPSYVLTTTIVRRTVTYQNPSRAFTNTSTAHRPSTDSSKNGASHAAGAA
jgi:hypothetical protein